MFAGDGMCFDVAVDHGFFNEAAFLTGIEDMHQTVRTLIDASPDAIQLSVGQARHLQDQPGDKPALVLRTDVANVYGPDSPSRLFSYCIEDAVGQALRLDAACLCVNLFLLEDAPEVHEQCVRNVSALKAEAVKVGMPLMVEPLVFSKKGDGYGGNGDIDLIMPLVRQAVELGADVIKADPTDDVEQYHRVIEVASGIPLLVRGGGRVPDRELLERTAQIMQQGAHGIVYGRNVIQHDSPTGITNALMSVVHDGASMDHAMGLLSQP
ncbi:MAG: aldolase [Planctomycetota bacterium]